MQATYEQHPFSLFAGSTTSFPRAVAAPVSPVPALLGQEELQAETFTTRGFQPRAFLVGLTAAMVALSLIQIFF